MSRAKRIVIDIETYRTMNRAVLERVRDEAIARQPAQNVKKELKDLWNTTDAMIKRAAEAVEKTALDPLLAEVLCVCMRVDGVPSAFTFMPLHEGDKATELQLLGTCLDEYAGPDTVWAGHNVAGFDLPVLTNVFRRYAVKPPEHFPKFRGKGFHGRVYDTMQRTPCANGLGLVSLDDVCEAMGMGAAKRVTWRGITMTGALVGECYDAGEYQTILEYCAADVEVEEQLYLQMTFGETWGGYDARDAVRDAIAEIRAQDTSEAAKKLGVYDVMDAAGLIPY